MKKVVAIWSFLRYANYGDDMQAIATALTIKELGYDTKVYQLDNHLAQRYNLHSSPTLEDLFEGVNLCILAGGGLLTPYNWYRRILQMSARNLELDFRNLLNYGRKHANLIFGAISIGGDGELHPPHSVYSNWRINFFSASNFIEGTVRLKGDVLQMQKFGKHMEYFPDMLFAASTFFSPDLLTPTNKYRVGFNLKKGKHSDEKMIADILNYAANNDDMEFHFITTHMEYTGLNYQYLPPEGIKNIYIHKYIEPCQLLGVIASMDCFVSSMLHVGLTGLSTGTPMLSYRGPGKTQSFLKSIGGEWAILPHDISFEEIKHKYLNCSKDTLYNRFNTEIIDKMKQECINHYDCCKQLVEKYA